MPEIFETDDQLRAAIGRRLGPSEWLEIPQEMIDRFAETTGDHQWIHVDVDRCRREAPGGMTIAHGFLTLSLVATLQPQVMVIKADKLLNYGANRLRFLNAVPSGSSIRLSQVITSVEPGSGGLRVTNEITIEIEGQSRPALIAELVFLKLD